MSGLYLLVALFFVPTNSYVYATNASENCFLTSKWHMIVTSNLPSDVKIFLQGDDMEQNLVLSFGNGYGWYFCDSGRAYTGKFTWGSKNTTLDLYNKHINKICYHYRFVMGTQHCYWLIRSEGFYVSRRNSPFPNSDWHFEYKW
ncbi:putative plant self-incompatibility S1 [Helianthus annuus]|nr:putative plant self-incompatibility S1 [Helianthus annuus]